MISPPRRKKFPKLRTRLSYEERYRIAEKIYNGMAIKEVAFEDDISTNYASQIKREFLSVQLEWRQDIVHPSQKSLFTFASQARKILP